MGIPSYYGTLISKMPHAIQRKVPQAVSALVVDMNCMIYHVLREPKMASIQYPGLGNDSAWEKKLQDEVCHYLTHIWRSAGSPGMVYVALDGVVPYAKIKQQRFRRFKSASMNTKVGEVVWDTNAITPGTSFMKRMSEALKTPGAKHGWIISDTDEPGEGEHKVLRWLLSTSLNPGPIIVYGLDADLILLCLLAGDTLGSQYPMYLLREAMAFGRLVRLKGSDEVDLAFFQVSVLKDALQRNDKWTREQFYDYIFGMSFCGNDFLPTGLSLRIRDEGHIILLSCLRDLWASNSNLIRFEGGVAVANPGGLKFFAEWMAKQEERLIVAMIQKKMTSRLSENNDDNLPLIEQSEKPLIEVCGDRIRLKTNWQDIYATLALGESTREQRKIRSEDFWKGWCWVLNYYQGRQVDLEWVYPAGYPPTWRDLCEFFTVPDGADCIQREPLKPQEQLALVLPMSSWNLLLNTPYRTLPSKLPQYWPQGFALESFGKRFGWECEPMIPMLTPGRLRFESKCAMKAQE
jgi:5'-3' exonuclease